MPRSRSQRERRRQWPYVVGRLPFGINHAGCALFRVRTPSPPYQDYVECDTVQQHDEALMSHSLINSVQGELRTARSSSSSSSSPEITAHFTSSPSPVLSSSSSETVKHDTIDVSPPSRYSLFCLQPTIWMCKPPGWHLKFYMRVDREGYIHTYPDVGGPFKNLPQAQNAINQHLDELHVPSIGDLSTMEAMIWSSLYWPDGTRRRRSISAEIEDYKRKMCHLVQALMDSYSDDNNLYGGLALEVKHIVHYHLIHENDTCYQHLNFAAKIKGAKDFDSGATKLFFAELSYLQGEDECTVRCFCIIDDNDNGHCYGCTNSGNADMKHPNNADAYFGGHLDVHLPFELQKHEDDYDDDLEAEATRLRVIYEGLDDPDVLESLFGVPLGDGKASGVEDDEYSD